jgi:hypothetical protein
MMLSYSQLVDPAMMFDVMVMMRTNENEVDFFHFLFLCSKIEMMRTHAKWQAGACVGSFEIHI